METLFSYFLNYFFSNISLWKENLESYKTNNLLPSLSHRNKKFKLSQFSNNDTQNSINIAEEE